MGLEKARNQEENRANNKKFCWHLLFVRM